jgi:thiamine biosynthesis lipoprotein
MGTRWSALLYASPETDVPALDAALARAVDCVDRQMSTWKLHSDLMRLNAASPGTWVSLPRQVMRVLVKGLEIGRLSGGAFDVGVGRLVDAWGFGSAGSVPDKGAIRAALHEKPPPTHTVLELDAPGARARKHGRFELDLSGIAKGFAVDEMSRTMKAFGIRDALVGLDGELEASGTRPDGTPWRIAVEKPDYELRSPLGIIELQDAAVATSGDYRHWIEVGGTRLSHTMDRSRGGPADNGIASVSVVAPTCMEADAWATALMVLGPTDGKALARKYGFDALIVERSGAALRQTGIGRTFEAVSAGEQLSGPLSDTLWPLRS